MHDQGESVPLIFKKLSPTREKLDPVQRAVNICSFGYNFISNGLEFVNAESIPETYDEFRNLALKSPLSFGDPHGPDTDEDRIPSSFYTLRDTMIESYFQGIENLDISEDEKLQTEEVIIEEFPANWEKFRRKLMLAFYARNDSIDWIMSMVAENQSAASALGVERKH